MPNSHTAPAWIAIMPVIFVLLWSTGFVGAKYGLPYAEPFTFLLLRFVIVALLLLAAALVLHAPWPASRVEFGHIAVAGVLVHAAYLGGVFSAIHQGVSAGEVALIAGLQPVLTAAVAGPVLGERVSARQWAGFVLGFLGVVLVVSNRLAPGGAGTIGYLSAVLEIAGITAGTLYQKRFCSHMDLRSGAVIQFSASAMLMAVLAPLTESMVVNWSGEFMFSLAWLVLVLSLGAISLLYLLIRHGEAARVTSMFYLVPPATALMAYALFGERLGAVALAGMGLVIAGVALVVARASVEK